MKKVIVRLANGLGNQLFIYAAAYAFAKKNNMKLIVDNESGFYKRYKYELHNFNITSQLADKNQKFVGFAGRARRKFLKNLDKIKKEKRFLVENNKKNKLTFYNEEQFNIISGETYLGFSTVYPFDFKKSTQSENATSFSCISIQTSLIFSI